MSDTSNSASTVKPWDCRWTPSEVYDSTESSSTSTEQGQDYSSNHKHRCGGGDFINPSGNHHDACRSQGCLCQVFLFLSIKYSSNLSTKIIFKKNFFMNRRVYWATLDQFNFKEMLLIFVQLLQMLLFWHHYFNLGINIFLSFLVNLF